MQQKEAPVFFCLQERKDCDRLQETARPTDSIRKQKGESSMPVIYHAAGATFHLYNPYYSYLIKLLPDGTPGQLYFGAPLRTGRSSTICWSCETAPCRSTAPPSGTASAWIR